MAAIVPQCVGFLRTDSSSRPRFRWAISSPRSLVATVLARRVVNCHGSVASTVKQIQGATFSAASAKLAMAVEAANNRLERQAATLRRLRESLLGVG